MKDINSCEFLLECQALLRGQLTADWVADKFDILKASAYEEETAVNNACVKHHLRELLPFAGEIGKLGDTHSDLKTDIQGIISELTNQDCEVVADLAQQVHGQVMEGFRHRSRRRRA